MLGTSVPAQPLAQQDFGEIVTDEAFDCGHSAKAVPLVEGERADLEIRAQYPEPVAWAARPHDPTDEYPSWRPSRRRGLRECDFGQPGHQW